MKKKLPKNIKPREEAIKEQKEKLKQRKMPSFKELIQGFSRDLGKYLMQGAPATSPLEYSNRLKACSTCPHFHKASKRCIKCGCFVGTKARWRTTTCPDVPPRWAPLVVTDSEKEKWNEKKKKRDERIKKLKNDKSRKD